MQECKWFGTTGLLCWRLQTLCKAFWLGHVTLVRIMRRNGREIQGTLLGHVLLRSSDQSGVLHARWQTRFALTIPLAGESVAKSFPLWKCALTDWRFVWVTLGRWQQVPQDQLSLEIVD